MFLYLALLYISIGLIPTGIALTLFFTYPMFTALLSWRFFGNRPTLFRWGVMAMILQGSALTMPAVNASISSNTWVGIGLGVASGFTYAFYTVLAQKSFETMHPVPFTWLSFAIALLLSGVSLLLWNLQDAQFPWLALWIGGLLSAIFTFAGHLLNNFGIRLIGAASASIVAATNPALTVVLAWFAIQETLTSTQLLGVLMVTLSVALLSWKPH
jgi:drug/metabolite transporter (DMT)-like permease